MRVWWTVGGVVGLWLLALLVVCISPFFVGTPFGMVVVALAWIGLLAAVIGLGVVSRRRWLAVAAPILTVLLAVLTFNWSYAAPASYLNAHQALFERAVDRTDLTDSYATRLPFGLRPLAAGGKVQVQDGTIFFPQWLGVPDDAAGYFWSPDRSPKDLDMYGTLCLDPVDLGGGWWSCGM